MAGAGTSSVPERQGLYREQPRGNEPPGHAGGPQVAKLNDYRLKAGRLVLRLKVACLRLKAA